MLFEDHYKHFSIVVLGADDFANTMPTVAAAAEKEATIIGGLRRVFGDEVFEGRRVIGADRAAVIEYHGFSPPVLLPVLVGVQVENLRADLAL